MSEARCIWVYAVTDGEPGALLTGLAGVGGQPVRALSSAGLTAVVAELDPAEFSEAALRRNLEDLSWVEASARAHHSVIEALAASLPTVPMPLATIYRSAGNAAMALAERAGDFTAALARISGRREWGVKAYQPPPEGAGHLAGTAAAGSSAAGRAAGPGAEYLRRRKAQLTAADDARQAAVASVRQVHAELSGLAAAARLYPPQAPSLSGQAAPTILNAAYLVDDGRAREFTAAVSALAARHQAVRLALSGPWPAYSFAGEAMEAQP